MTPTEKAYDYLGRGFPLAAVEELTTEVGRLQDEIEQLKVSLVGALKERDLWRERTLSKTVMSD